MPDNDTLTKPCEHINDISQLKTDVADIKERLTNVESMKEDVSAILGAIDKIARQFKIWGPSIIAAAVSAGIVNGKLGLFLRALFTGTH